MPSGQGRPGDGATHSALTRRAADSLPIGPPDGGHMPLVLLALLIPDVPRQVDHFQAALDAARQREERLKTLSITWKLAVHVPRGGRMDADPVGLPLPREDQTWEATHSLVVDGDRFRLEYDNLSGPSGQVEQVFVFDGTRTASRTFVRGRGESPILAYEEPTRPAGIPTGEVMDPLILWCRGLGWWTAPHRRERVEARNRLVPIDGSRWCEFRLRRGAGPFDSYWLDVDQDYGLRRIDRRLEQVIEVLDVTYQAHAVAGWAPHSWTETRTRRDGKLARTIRAEVTDIRVGEPIPPETFRLEPLPGETVVDEPSGKTFRVRPDGSLEEIDPAGGPVLSNDEGVKQLPASPWRTALRVVVIAGLGAVLLVALVLRRRGRPGHTPSP